VPPPLQLRWALARLRRPHAAATSTAAARPFWSAGASTGAGTFEDVLLECNNINTLAHVLWARIVQPGDTVVDATAGNGFDALALAQLALPPGEGASAGRLVALDLQEAAVEATRARLAAALAPAQLARCELVHGCHSRLGDHVAPDSARLVAFNLGFLPQRNAGAGSKACITRPDTTAAALAAAQRALAVGGCISVMVYQGHEGGAEEAAVVDAFAAALPPRQWTSTTVQLLNRQQAPRMVLMYRRHCGAAEAARAAAPS
jgi:hypothetical protein